MTPRLPAGALASLTCAALLAGCQLRAPEAQVSIDRLVADYNANARKVPRLWARARITVSLPGSIPVSTAGLLMLAKTADPLGSQDFVLIGYENLAVELFRLGSSAAEGKYYFWYGLGGSGRAWWGWHKYAGADGVEEMPVDPNQLLSVLSVCALPRDFSRLPTVALSMTHRPGQRVAGGQVPAYVLTYIDRQPQSRRIIFKREIFFNWDDSALRRPFLVRLFDGAGHRVMTARLRDYQAIRTDPPQARAPVMPTDIEISWPAKDSKVHIRLSEMTTEDKWDPDNCRFLEFLPAGLDPARIRQVDRSLETGGPGR